MFLTSLSCRLPSRSAKRSSPEDAEASLAEIAEAGHDADLGILDLPVTRIAAQLVNRFHDMVHAEHVGFGEQAPVSVEGQLAAYLDASPSSTKGPPSPRLQKPASSSCWITWKVKGS